MFIYPYRNVGDRGISMKYEIFDPVSGVTEYVAASAEFADMYCRVLADDRFLDYAPQCEGWTSRRRGRRERCVESLRRCAFGGRVVWCCW